MDLSELMLSRLCLDEDENEDSQNLTWVGFPKICALPPNLPELEDDLVEIIIWKHIASQPIHRFFLLKCVSKKIRALLTEPKLLKIHPLQEFWLLKQNRVRKLRRMEESSDDIFCLDTYDSLQKRSKRIPVPYNLPSLTFPFCQCWIPKWISSGEWSFSSCQGGESGLIYLQNFRASTSASSSSMKTPIGWLAFNPMTKSVRELTLCYKGNAPQIHCLRSIDRFSAGYVSWASDGGEEMYPLHFDPVMGAWERIGSGFTTRGRIMVEKAVRNEVVYLRYEKQDFKDLVIMYDILQGSFSEELTTGLPNHIRVQHLFHYQQHIFLAVVLSNPSTRSGVANIILYELETTELKWMKISDIPPSQLVELTGAYPALFHLKFLCMDHELLVASLVTERKSDGVHVFSNGTTPRRHCIKSNPCGAVVVYDLNACLWRREEASRLGPNFDVHTTVFRPRLDIEP